MSLTEPELQDLCIDIKGWCAALGFAQTHISDLELGDHPSRLRAWLAAGKHGEMAYLENREGMRADPRSLLPGATRAIVVTMDYLVPDSDPLHVLGDHTLGYVSRYALGRDYHKALRRRLAKLAERINSAVGPAGFRACVDSAPLLEKALAERAGIGWFGKHTLIMNRSSGSWFFLGVLLTDVPLPIDVPQRVEHCGSCTACIDVCPTQAITGPRELDARRCISYLTIELKGAIPIELRAPIGNRIFGCDDCQLFCPWNRYAKPPQVIDFQPRHKLEGESLLGLFAWTAQEFDERTKGSALRRISYEQWQRNVAIALGNAPYERAIVEALEQRSAVAAPLVKEHCEWAINQQRHRELTPPHPALR